MIEGCRKFLGEDSLINVGTINTQIEWFIFCLRINYVYAAEQGM